MAGRSGDGEIPSDGGVSWAGAVADVGAGVGGARVLRDDPEDGCLQHLFPPVVLRDRMGLVVKWRVRVQLRTWSGDRFAAETRVLYGFRAVQTTCRVMQFTL
ncbi:MAG: hypothetical protein ACYTBS_22140, partial [Planctomycetota bacterium]